MTRPPHGGLRRLAIIGGGRWARVIAGVLLEIAPADARIQVHTPGNAAAMREWSVNCCSGRIEIFESLPDFSSHSPDAVIVANAARDHARVARESLRVGIPTLVEKPLALCEADARDLIALAERNNAFLAVSRVLLFARYVDTFARAVAGAAPLRQVRVAWADPKAETRHGEIKQYDPGVVLFADMLPHIVPILRKLVGQPAAFVGIAMAAGGMRAEIELMAGAIPCTVSLARNAASRQRSVDVETPNRSLCLDFSPEPGRISIGDTEQDGDPDWNSQPRPLAHMLQTFLTCAAEGGDDERLAAASAIEDCRIADQALPIYSALQIEWLVARLGQPLDDGIRYAVAEILAGHDRNAISADADMAPIWQFLTGLGAGAVRDMLGHPGQRDTAVRMLLGRIA